MLLGFVCGLVAGLFLSRVIHVVRGSDSLDLARVAIGSLFIMPASKRKPAAKSAPELQNAKAQAAAFSSQTRT